MHDAIEFVREWWYVVAPLTVVMLLVLWVRHRMWRNLQERAKSSKLGKSGALARMLNPEQRKDPPHHL